MPNSSHLRVSIINTSLNLQRTGLWPHPSFFFFFCACGLLLTQSFHGQCRQVTSLLYNTATSQRIQSNHGRRQVHSQLHLQAGPIPRRYSGSEDQQAPGLAAGQSNTVSSPWVQREPISKLRWGDAGKDTSTSGLHIHTCHTTCTHTIQISFLKTIHSNFPGGVKHCLTDTSGIPAAGLIPCLAVVCFFFI